MSARTMPLRALRTWGAAALTLLACHGIARAQVEHEEEEAPLVEPAPEVVDAPEVEPSPPPSSPPPTTTPAARPATPPTTSLTTTSQTSPTTASPTTTSPSTTGTRGTTASATTRTTAYADEGRPYAGDRQDRDGEDDEEEDRGDPYDFLWLEAFGGWSYVDLRAIQQTNFYPEFVRLRGDGPMGGAAAGFRIEFLSVGVRAAVAHYGDEFDVGTATGEVTLTLPIPIVKPYLRAGFGFAWHGDSNFMAPEMSQTTVFGWAFSGAIGLDVYFVDWFAVGAAVTADILNMSRQSIDDPMPMPGEVVFEDSGDAVGAQVRGHIAISFHL